MKDYGFWGEFWPEASPVYFNTMDWLKPVLWKDK